MELELTEKSLPEGSIKNPVARYLYFPLPDKKKRPITSSIIPQEVRSFLCLLPLNSLPLDISTVD